MIAVFNYEDYRSFLGDFYKETKKQKPQFSFRSFALKAKLNSPNYLKLVIDGKRRITEPQIPKFLKGLGLQGYEANYFVSLVQLENTTTTEMRSYHFEQLAHLKKVSKVVPQFLDEKIQEQLSHWETWALREFFQIPGSSTDENVIQKNLRFPTETKTIREAIDLLKMLGLLVEDGKGLKTTQPILIMGDKIKSEALKNLHKEYLQLAAQSIQVVAREDRRLAGLTLALKKKDFEKISKQLIQYISELNKTYSGNSDPEEIYHLEVALFPLTQTRRTPK